MISIKFFALCFIIAITSVSVFSSRLSHSNFQISFVRKNIFSKFEIIPVFIYKIQTNSGDGPFKSCIPLNTRVWWFIVLCKVNINNKTRFSLSSSRTHYSKFRARKIDIYLINALKLLRPFVSRPELSYRHSKRTRNTRFKRSNLDFVKNIQDNKHMRIEPDYSRDHKMKVIADHTAYKELKIYNKSIVDTASRGEIEMSKKRYKVKLLNTNASLPEYHVFVIPNIYSLLGLTLLALIIILPVYTLIIVILMYRYTSAMVTQ